MKNNREEIINQITSIEKERLSAKKELAEAFPVYKTWAESKSLNDYKKAVIAGVFNTDLWDKIADCNKRIDTLNEKLLKIEKNRAKAV